MGCYFFLKPKPWRFSGLLYYLYTCGVFLCNDVDIMRTDKVSVAVGVVPYTCRGMMYERRGGVGIVSTTELC